MEKELKISFESIRNYDSLDDTEKKLFDAAKKIRENAYAAYSHFHVGCAVLLENGEIITGSNQENAAYPSGLCAERVAIFQSGAIYPEAKIVKMAISAVSKSRISPTITTSGS